MTPGRSKGNVFTFRSPAVELGANKCTRCTSRAACNIAAATLQAPVYEVVAEVRYLGTSTFVPARHQMLVVALSTMHGSSR